MKQHFFKIPLLGLALALLAPAGLMAQKEEKDKEKKEVQQIIVTRKGDKDEKVVIEINGDKITVNGKSLDEYKGKDGNINVRVNKLRDPESLTFLNAPKGGYWGVNGDNKFEFYTGDENRAMLGVNTEKVEEGARVEDVTEGSAAEKAGLKENDIITKIDDKKIENPDDLSAAVKSHKPGDKVTVTYLRDKKEQKATAELTKWKGVNALSLGDGRNFNMDQVMPKIQAIPHMKDYFGQNWTWSSGSPKLGLSVQDSEDGKGVKVVDVDEESNAEKAGIKTDDVITEVDGKAVNNADDMVKMIRESKDKISIMVKLLRNGKTQNVEVKMPRKLKTAEL